MRIRHAFLAVLLAAGAPASATAAPPLPVEHFTKHALIDDVAVSPSGKRLAVLMHGTDGYRRLGVMDLEPLGKPRVIGQFDDADVHTARWVSDDRIVFTAYQRGPEVRDGGAGTFAVDHDGTRPRTLIAWSTHAGVALGTGISTRVLPYGWVLHSAIDDGSNDVLVYRVVRDHRDEPTDFVPARLNTVDGTLKTLSYGMPAGTYDWLLDAAHEPRAVTTWRKGRQGVFLRDAKDGRWEQVSDVDAFGEGGFVPWFIEPDGRLVVEARAGGRDTIGLHAFDAGRKQVEPDPMVGLRGFDLDPVRVVDTRSGRLLGIHFRADRPMSHWFDEKMQAIQAGIDAALPGRFNRLHCGRCESSRFVVVASQSDRQPTEYLLFDRERRSMQPIGASRPWIDASTQGARSFHRVATRDGLSMPVVVTKPAGASADTPLPTVVLVHGGPWLRGTDLGWRAEAQFLASRGYLVLEPEFRGSWGYGFRHFRAGFKQWGRAMQDDLADAVQWAAAQRLADPARVCVMGGSYGGYASLMATITHPTVFRCAASFAGVSDIDLMYSISWSDATEAARRYSMPVLVGDRDKDADQLAATSPLKRAGEIEVPLLLAHGSLDRRVPVEHARRFESAARRGGVAVESVYYADEGHGWFHVRNHTDFYGRLERFLDQALKAPPR